MIRVLLYIILLFGLTLATTAQDIQYAEDFESYKAGSYLGSSSDQWTTWSKTTGGSEDVKISSAKAKSGSNSIYFSSSAPNGGPIDMIHYFSDKLLTKGQLSYSMNMYVETGAYFNFQGDYTVGEVWAINGRLEKGEGQIYNGSRPLVNFSYPQSKWFNLEIIADLTNNSWKVLIDDNCIGSFGAPVNKVASLNIFPLNGDSYYIDDVSYTYTERVKSLANDIAVTISSYPPYTAVGNKISLRGKITNNGSENISNTKLKVTSKEGSFEQEISGINLKKGEKHTFDIDQKATIQEGSNSIKIEVLTLNGDANLDQEICNNSASIQVRGIKGGKNKKVLIEQATGTWCGFCPSGAVLLDRISHYLPNNVVSIAIHGNDPMDNRDISTPFGAQSYPTFKVDRAGFISTGAVENTMVSAATTDADASMLVGAKETGDKAHISLTINADKDIAKTKKIVVVITENNVTGTSSNYGQANYYGRDGIDLIGIDGVNWKDLPSKVPAKDMVYQHVARAILTPFNGVLCGEEDIKAGQKATINFSYTIPAKFKKENLNIVTIILNEDGSAHTAEETSLTDALTNGFIEGAYPVNTESIVLDNATRVFPNPTSGITTIASNITELSDVDVKILDISGRVILHKNFPRQLGYFNTSIDATNLAPGVYIVRLGTKTSYTSKKLTVYR